jgi:hypothetical protein
MFATATGLEFEAAVDSQTLVWHVPLSALFAQSPEALQYASWTPERLLYEAASRLRGVVNSSNTDHKLHLELFVFYLDVKNQTYEDIYAFPTNLVAFQ